jgi:hypothetical protein
MAYSDPNLVHNPSTGAVAPAAWGDVVRDDLEFLVDPPKCSIYNSAAQSIPNNTTTALTANSENFDTDAMHSTVSLTSRVVAQTAGRYLVNAAVLFASHATGRRALDLRVNGTTTHNIDGRMTVTTGNSMAITGMRLLTLAAGDYVEGMVLQTSGGALDVTLNELGAVYEGR